MKNISRFGGSTLSAEDIQRVEITTSLSLPHPLASMLMARALVGLTFVLDEQRDQSGLGAEFRWMTPAEMIDDATGAYPGIAAIRQGFLPVGICLEGTGDPYFLRLADGAIVRIPHDSVRRDSIELTRIEAVATSIDDLIEASEIVGPLA